MRFWRFLGLCKTFGMESIWASHLLLASLKTKFLRKLKKGWEEVSQVERENFVDRGRETLIKAVAQAIPSYVMSCFQLPKGLCDDIEGMMRRFWWGQRGHELKIAWVSWKRLCKSKLRGGMVLETFRLSTLPC